MNKQGLWFLTLFSLILVLSIYYITIPSKTLSSNETKTEVKEVSKEEIGLIETLKVELKEQRAEEVSKLEAVINGEATAEEKNTAYEALKELTSLQGIEENLEKKIHKQCNLEAFVKASNNEINVTIEEDKHDTKLANSIMRVVQEEYKEPITVSVKFS